MLGKRNQRGDTLVEVLIAITVIGFILAGAYVLAQTSTFAVRRAAERAQALQLAQTQVEELRSDSLGTSPEVTLSTYDSLGTVFCVASGNPNPGTIVIYNPSSCWFKDDGSSNNPPSVQPAYHIQVTISSPATSQYNVTVTVNWIQIGSTVATPPGNLVFQYRIWQ